jgi:hypothetical protein
MAAVYKEIPGNLSPKDSFQNFGQFKAGFAELRLLFRLSGHPNHKL